MDRNKIAPKKEAKNESTPEKVVFKHMTSPDETFVKLAKPRSSTIKRNPKECVEMSKNLECLAVEDSKNLVKAKESSVDVEAGEMIPKDESKEVKSENVVHSVEANLKEGNKEENIEVIELIEDQPNMISNAKIDSDPMMKGSKKTEEVEKGGKFEQKPSDSNKTKNSKSSTKIKIGNTKTSKTKKSKKSKKMLQKIKQFFHKWRPCWLFLLFIALVTLSIWIFSALEIDVKSGGVGGTSTHFYGSGSGGPKDHLGSSNNNNKETGK